MVLEGDIASGVDGHLDINFGLLPVSVLFREAFSHPCISFFHLLVNSFSVINKILVSGYNYDLENTLNAD